MSKKKTTKVVDTIFESTLNISDDKKVDILIAMMHDIRNSIDSWTNRSFQAVSWSGGILLAFVGYWITKAHKVVLLNRIFLALGICLFGMLIQIYLFRVKSAHSGNGNLLSKIEATLRLTEKNFYIHDKYFFKYTGKWIPPKSLTILQVMNLIIIIFAISVAIAF